MATTDSATAYRAPASLSSPVCHTGFPRQFATQATTYSTALSISPLPLQLSLGLVLLLRPPSSLPLLCTSCISLHSCSSSICRRASASRLSSASHLRVSIQLSFSTSPLLTPARSSPPVPTRLRCTRLSNRAFALLVVSSNVLEHVLPLLRPLSVYTAQRNSRPVAILQEVQLLWVLLILPYADLRLCAYAKLSTM